MGNATEQPKSPIALIAADMLQVLAAEPKAPHASVQRGAGGLTVTLSRSMGHRLLTLEGAGPLDMDTADAWARAVGAPHRDWWATRQGCRLTLDWWEGE